jgi:FSR family fosmidomycin resistance protein-like MFS transporter
MLTLFASVSVLAILAGGQAAERFGYKRIIVACAVFSILPYFLFAFSRIVFLEMAMIALIGVAMNGSRSTLIAMAQSFMPNSIGLASGFILGIGTAVGGLTAPLFGMLADHFGLSTAMYSLVGIALFTAGYSALLPKSSRGLAPQT